MQDQTSPLPQHQAPIHVYICSSWLPGCQSSLSFPGNSLIFIHLQYETWFLPHVEPSNVQLGPVWLTVPFLGHTTTTAQHCAPALGDSLQQGSRQSWLPKHSWRTQLEGATVPNLPRDQKQLGWGGAAGGLSFLPTLLISISVPQTWQLCLLCQQR